MNVEHLVLHKWEGMKASFQILTAYIEKTYIALRELDESSRAFSARPELSMHGYNSPSLVSGIVEQTQLPCFVLSIPQNPQFSGRADVLARLHDHLLPSTKPQGLCCYTLHGTGGVGKTQVAAAFAYHAQHAKPSAFKAIFWIRSDTEAALRQSFLDIALGLRLLDIMPLLSPMIFERRYIAGSDLLVRIHTFRIPRDRDD